jgi:hypothetical protein
MTYYQRVYCYRVRESTDKKKVTSAVDRAGGHWEYRRDSIDLYIPEGTALTQFLLVWADHLTPLDYLDFYRPRIDKY